MKTMTCQQLGGACNKAFHANSFDEIAQQSKQHGKEMFQKQDQAHLDEMVKMELLMKHPAAMVQWYQDKKNQFESLPED